jgi:GNAT superfamily N-acetyltransferase
MQARKEAEIPHAGLTVNVRPASSADREALGMMLSRLSRRTIYERFHVPYPSVPGWALAAMAEADHRDRGSLVAVAGDEILGHAMYVRAANGREAEFAVVVEDRWQSNGLGKRLLTELAAAAGSRGIELFTGTVLGENRGALRALSAAYPEMRYEIKDGVYQVRVPLRALPHQEIGERAA